MSKIKLSKSQWELIGKTAGWLKTAKLLSHCCNEEDRPVNPDRGATFNFYSDINMCPKCKKTCGFYDPIQPDNPSSGVMCDNCGGGSHHTEECPYSFGANPQ